ncbi:DMT family transporter [uncultured Gordonia sp.]|uniref:DMT family transporter n=1 Tax=Gordonia sp. (in: high G+C Gram-positive bacteria) TaxID=84139 RepID=UPI002636A70C|nr:DMT family transporter [uncultured Gordonia sp.]HNP57618.1 DMT family transporter [Gordonia sp. (in: high G+C Gram-positive bacteria)]
MHTWLPTVLAIVAAFLIALGTVIRQRESADSGAINAKWWIGAVIAVGGFAAQATALGLGAILLVQPLIVLAVLFALPMEAWADDRHPHLNEWVWGLILVASVVTFLLIAQPEQSSRRPDFATLAFATSAVIAGVAILVVLAEKASDNHYRALYYGLAAGVMFGVSALLVKAVIMQAMDDWAIVFTHPQLYVLLIIAPGAIVAQQRGFGAGDLQTSFPAMNVMEPAVAMALGLIVLGEDIKVSVKTALFLGIVLALMIRAVVELARLAAVRADIVHEHHMAHLGLDEDFVQTDTGKMPPVEGE